MCNECIKNDNKIAAISSSIIREQVEARMWVLMPAWFDMQDELMSANEPFFSIRCITEILCDNPERNIDDVIHEFFADDWFDTHEDGCEDW